MGPSGSRQAADHVVVVDAVVVLVHADAGAGAQDVVAVDGVVLAGADVDVAVVLADGVVAEVHVGALDGDHLRRGAVGVHEQVVLDDGARLEVVVLRPAAAQGHQVRAAGVVDVVVIDAGVGRERRGIEDVRAARAAADVAMIDAGEVAGAGRRVGAAAHAALLLLDPHPVAAAGPLHLAAGDPAVVRVDEQDGRQREAAHHHVLGVLEAQVGGRRLQQVHRAQLDGRRRGPLGPDGQRPVGAVRHDQAIARLRRGQRRAQRGGAADPHHPLAGGGFTPASRSWDHVGRPGPRSRGRRGSCTNQSASEPPEPQLPPSTLPPSRCPRSPPVPHSPRRSPHCPPLHRRRSPAAPGAAPPPVRAAGSHERPGATTAPGRRPRCPARRRPAASPRNGQQQRETSRGE